MADLQTYLRLAIPIGSETHYIKNTVVIKIEYSWSDSFKAHHFQRLFELFHFYLLMCE